MHAPWYIGRVITRLPQPQPPDHRSRSAEELWREIADPDGSVSWYNQRWYEYTATNFEEMRGSGWQKVIHPEHAARMGESLERSWTSGDPWENTFPLGGGDGDYRWFLSRALPIREAAAGS